MRSIVTSHVMNVPLTCSTCVYRDTLGVLSISSCYSSFVVSIVIGSTCTFYGGNLVNSFWCVRTFCAQYNHVLLHVFIVRGFYQRFHCI